MSNSASDFEAAAAYLRGIAGKLSSEDLLYFYARFKQAEHGQNNVPKPGFFDFQGKQKWQAWKDLGDMDPNVAKEQYVSRLSAIDPDWSGKSPNNEIGWVSVSRPKAPEEPELNDEDKTIFDHIKEGQVAKVHDILKKDAAKANLTDEEGMTPLHWCADRGQLEILRMLLRYNADVNAQDSDGQTALHYAASCEREDIIKLLLKSGINTDIQDNDHMIALEVCSPDQKYIFDQ